MTGPEGNSEFYFPGTSMFPEMKSNQWKTNNYIIDKQQRATAVNISRETVNCFLFDVILVTSANHLQMSLSSNSGCTKKFDFFHWLTRKDTQQKKNHKVLRISFYFRSG